MESRRLVALASPCIVGCVRTSIAWSTCLLTTSVGAPASAVAVTKAPAANAARRCFTRAIHSPPFTYLRVSTTARILTAYRLCKAWAGATVLDHWTHRGLPGFTPRGFTRGCGRSAGAGSRWIGRLERNVLDTPFRLVVKRVGKITTPLLLRRRLAPASRGLFLPGALSRVKGRYCERAAIRPAGGTGC